MGETEHSTNDAAPGERLAGSAFAHYGEALHHFLVRRLRRTQDAGDLMQEVFLRLLRLKRVDLIRNPQAYLFGIASRVVRDYRVEAQELPVIFDSDLVRQRSERPAAVLPDAMADGIGLERQIERALELLSPVQAQIFLLERFEGLSQAQIATRLGLSPHTVKKYAVQALAFVRQQCRSEEEPKGRTP